MSTTDTLPSLDELLSAKNSVKVSREWQDQLWQHWPAAARWPGILGIYEAAAFLRISHATIRRLCTAGRDDKAKLRNQRVAGIFRIRKVDLENLGLIQERAAA
ncbi:helix-turn-helix domain-containing protein [Oleiharenicola lentus]|uniref:helix-turn-helix domain-containing protein n=1 Tax=Oleiharenicola lentus TaxID=2508720 RepID=UPI003F66CD38